MFNCLLLNYSSSAATRTTHEESITRENISQWQKYFNVQSVGNKTSSPEISVSARALRSPNAQHGWLDSLAAASFQIHFIYHRLPEREVRWGVWGQRRRLLSWYLLTSKCPQLCGRDGAGLVTIRDNCDDNDILVCNVCVHRVSGVRTLNTRWWGSGGHRGQLPRVQATSSPPPLSFLTQLRSSETEPTVSLARCWYKLNVIPSQGSVINDPPRLSLCCQDRVVSCFQSSFSPLPLSRQLSDLWRPAHHLDWITTKLNSLNSTSVSIIRKVHLLFIRNICSILLPSFHLHFLWPSCPVWDTFHYRTASGSQHPLADIFHLVRNFYPSSPLPPV